MLRCFIAIDLSDTIREELRTLQDAMRKLHPPVRFTDPAGIHLTLKFLGAVQENLVDRIKQNLNECRTQNGFDIGVHGLGAFPTLSSPRVFWMGIDNPPLLSQLQNRVEEELSWMEIRETRPFHPHLTLARAKERKGLAPLIEYIKINAESFDAGTLSVRGFHLYQSILKPGGSQYVKMASFALT
jgi:2'-5' RNA ligase